MATPEEARVARTETVFRQANERVAEIAESFGSEEAEFLCECADPGCDHRVKVPLDEYEDVREESTHFLVVDGHEVPKYERVMRRRRGYSIVKKFTRGLAAAVRRTDPRADSV
jgi:hypothetical protein